MKQKIKTPPPPERNRQNPLVPWHHYLPALTLAFTLLVTPFFPDEKLNRLKLITLGSGLIAAGLLWGLSRIFSAEFKWSRSPLDWPMAVYGVVAVLFYKTSQNPATAASEFQRMIFSLLILILILDPKLHHVFQILFLLAQFLSYSLLIR